MSLTVGGWILFIILALCIFGVAVWIGVGLIDSKVATCVSMFVAVALCGLLLGIFNWYYTSTASGARAVKTQQSEFSKGIERIVTVYDMEGDVIKTYEGKFDVTYDNDRILFDDEKGQRHIIYYPTGTVIIDEVESK